MNYQQFVSVVEKEIKENAGENVKIHLHTVIKNNGKERKGITLSEEGINISPTIYLEEYYEKYQNGRAVSSIAVNIIGLYKEVRFQQSWEGKYIQDFEKVKNHIVYKLIHRRKNEKLLEEIPYVPFLDLAIVFYVLVELNQHGSATMTVREEHLKSWGINREHLAEAADKNTKKLLPAEFKTMKAVVEEMLTLEETEDGDDYMYVLSNKVRNFGACCILYKGVLEQIGHRLDENYYVLPSSVHEVIIIPESMSPKKEDLARMVTEINETQVATEEILSNTPYYYSRKDRRLLI